MPLIAVLGSRLAEIGVRITFFVMTSTAALLFEELDERVEKLAQKCANNSKNSSEITADLHQWKIHYDLVCRFTESINICFGPSLLLICGIDFAIPIIEFQDILLQKTFCPRYYFRFIHIILRFLLILIASSRVESKVRRLYFICLHSLK